MCAVTHDRGGNIRESRVGASGSNITLATRVRQRATLALARLQLFPIPYADAQLELSKQFQLGTIDSSHLQICRMHQWPTTTGDKAAAITTANEDTEVRGAPLPQRRSGE